MKEFTLFTSTVLPLKVDNIDTDQIIPARFLKSVGREGFGDKLFHDWRFDENGKNKDSVFFDPRFKNAQILLAGNNFGVGSSREHAVWAIKDYGFRVVISSAFGDIFYNNALKNGLLTIQLKPNEIDKLFQAVEKDTHLILTISLPDQTVATNKNHMFSFPIDPFRKACLIKGVDDLGYLLDLDKEITEFEMSHKIYI